MIEAFESAVADLVGVRHAIAVSSGTAALHLALLALGIGEGDEVILPSFTFVAVGNVILHQRATPVFADIDPVTFNLDPHQIEARITKKTRGIIVVHTFGYPADLAPILEIARRHNLAVIEDACEALGAEYQGRRAGGIGDFGVFGFYPNKQITTGEGGMVVTSNPEHAETIRALGAAQMKRLPQILERRLAVAAHYSEVLQQTPEITTPAARLSWFVYTVSVNRRDAVWERMAANGIGCGRYFEPLHRQPLFAPFAARDLPVTNHVAARTLQLPFFNYLTEDQIAEVCSHLRST